MKKIRMTVMRKACYQDLMEKYENPIQNLSSKILWLESNSEYIKDLLDLYNIISQNILNKGEDHEFLFKQILYCISSNEIKNESKDKKSILASAAEKWKDFKSTLTKNNILPNTNNKEKLNQPSESQLKEVTHIKLAT